MTTRSAPRVALIVGAGIGDSPPGWRFAGPAGRFGSTSVPRTRAIWDSRLGWRRTRWRRSRELGLAETMLAEGVATTKAEVRQTDGRLIRAFAAQVGGPMVIALRQALHGALMNAVGRDALVLDSEVIGVAGSDTGVSLALKDGRTAEGDVLIGADGAGSVVRRHLHPHEPPFRPSGFCALRGVAYGVGGHLGDLAAVGYLGDGIEAATARASQDAVYWYVSLLAADVADDGKRRFRE